MDISLYWLYFLSSVKVLNEKPLSVSSFVRNFNPIHSSVYSFIDSVSSKSFPERGIRCYAYRQKRHGPCPQV